MPDEALPQSWPDRPMGAVNLRRDYLDILGRPMIGSAIITGRQGLATASVTVALVNGRLDVDLPPDTYTVQASLRTVDGTRTTDTQTVTIAA